MAAACAAEPPLTRFEYAAVRMGSEVRILLYANEQREAAVAAAAAFARIAHLDSLLSDYRTDSEIDSVARAAGGAPVAISDELLLVMRHALHLAEETGGAFDPTVGPVTRVWRSARRVGREPDPVLIAAAHSLVDWRSVELDTVRRTIRLTAVGMRLDLGGIAKGYAADEALQVLAGRGMSSALIVFGGDIVAGRAPPNEIGWRVRVQTGPDSVIHLVNAALSTSGDSEQFLEIDGVRYSHVIDPRTSRGLTRRVQATVRAPDGITADALATAVTLLEGDRRARLIAAHPEAQVHISNPDTPHMGLRAGRSAGATADSPWAHLQAKPPPGG